MKARKLRVTGLAFMYATGAFSQVQRPSIGLNPDANNRDLELAQQARLLDEQRAADKAQRHNVKVEKFKRAVALRKARFPDFDAVVFHGNAPVTPVMLDAMSESPYAADIAYYLGKHPEQSGAIAGLAPAKVTEAMHQIEAALVERDHSAQTAIAQP